ncbi:cysteine desulfurase family protein [Tenacibaculum amylolyticum]|uniref:cysteine desulfurase family protein n=1 Tax=Tenacibaculum amylolyticum TaxID=104269 RepID=UPI0038B53B1C
MKTIYFDNAATTPMLSEVITVMQEAMETNYGNPSSTHQMGRKAKVVVETARKKIAKQLKVTAKEIVFVSSGTEGNNLILNNAVKNLNIERIVTTKIEHHAVLNVVENLRSEHGIEIVYLPVNKNGEVDIEVLKLVLLENDKKTMVSLMMVNNEIGNILPVKEVSEICQESKALLHTDAVQAVGHIDINLEKYPVDFLVASAHKFHGPKGIGFVYFNDKHIVKPMLLGGNQEKGIRSSTENVHGILGMEKALEMSLQNLETNKEYVLSLKKYFCEKLKEVFQDVSFNGNSSDAEKSSPYILNVRFPISDKMLLFNLDLSGVMASSGSACQSGGKKVSHVLKEMLDEDELNKTSIRFSFSKFSTKEQVETVIDKIKLLLKK